MYSACRPVLEGQAGIVGFETQLDSGGNRHHQHFDSAINGVTIHFSDKELTNLTDLWRSGGSPYSKKPYEWMRLDSSKEFIENFERIQKSGYPEF